VFHEKKILWKTFDIGQKVLLYNYWLHLFLGKLIHLLWNICILMGSLISRIQRMTMFLWWMWIILKYTLIIFVVKMNPLFWIILIIKIVFYLTLLLCFFFVWLFFASLFPTLVKWWITVIQDFQVNFFNFPW